MMKRLPLALLADPKREVLFRAAVQPEGVLLRRDPGAMLLACLTAIHVALVAAMLWWAFILILPAPTFATSKSYVWFATHWPFSEDRWAGMFLLAAVLGIPGFLPFNGTLCGVRNIWWRLSSSTFLGMAHGSVAAATLVSNPGSTGPGIYGIMAALAAFRIVVEVML